MVPRLAQGMRVDGEVVGGFHVDVASEAVVLEVDFAGVEDVEEVDAEAAVEVGVEGFEEFGGCFEEIAEDHQAALAFEQRQGAGQGGGERGGGAGGVGFEGGEDFVKVFAGRAGWQELADALVEQGERDPVVFRDHPP